MKEVTVLGMGASHVELKEPHGGCWAVIYQVQYKHHIDRLFCVHDWGEYDPDTMGLIRRRQSKEGFEIISAMPLPNGLKGRRYPIEDVIQDFQVRYFRDSVCYMLALAIHERYDIINCYGLDCRAYSSYAEEKPPTEFWCGIARGRGIELRIATMSPLCRLMDDSPCKLVSLPPEGFINQRQEPGVLSYVNK